jgi:RNA polymerase sigma-70 factor (ECF subfamily)
MAGDQTVSHDWCEALYERQAAALLLYGRALGLGHSEAEDVLQATFEALLKLPTAPEDPCRYCLRAYRNRALNHRRGWLARIRRELESSRWFEREPGETERERTVMRQLARLPQPQREVIVLKFWHGRTFEQIGELLGISPNTAAGRFRYGLDKLRNFLNQHDHERNERTGEPDAGVDATTSFIADCDTLVRTS